MWNMQLVQDNKHIHIMHVVICLIFFGAHMNILLIIKMKILVLINRSYRFSFPPPILLTIKCKMVDKFWARSQSFFLVNF